MLCRTPQQKKLKMVFAHSKSAPTRNIATPTAERARFYPNDADVVMLAEDAIAIEKHYSRMPGGNFCLNGTRRQERRCSDPVRVAGPISHEAGPLMPASGTRPVTGATSDRTEPEGSNPRARATPRPISSL